MSPLEALTVTTHRWLVGEWGRQEPCPISYTRGRGLRSYQAQAAGGLEVLWLVGKELLAPWPPFPGRSFQVPPVQINIALCLHSLVKSYYCPGSLGAPVLSLRDSIGEATVRGTMLSLPQCPLPEPGSLSLDLLCDLRQAPCPLRVSLLPQGFLAPRQP